MSSFTSLLTILLCSFSLTSFAQEARELGKPYEEFGDYKIFFSVFNSSFIPAKVAEAYQLVRGSNRALVNIAILKNGQIRGGKAKLSGQYKNLIQQVRTLDFIEIKEQNATYYLAPLRFDDEEVLHFQIEVTPWGEQQSHRFSFHRKMSTDKT